jgi:hypothetical protein
MSAEEGRYDKKYPIDGVMKMEQQKENSERRTLLRKIVHTTALAGIGALILGQTNIRNPIPQVHANNGDPLTIGTANTGTSTTQLTSSPPLGKALEVDTADPDGAAIRGFATATSGGTQFEGPPFDPLNNTPIGTIGVIGRSDHPNGTGVFGHATTTSPGIGDDGGSTGVFGICESADGRGVIGWANASTLGPNDVSIGAVGRNEATSGAAFGVMGRTNSPDGAGVRARNLADGIDLLLATSGIMGLTPRTADPTTRATWQLYIFDTGKNDGNNNDNNGDNNDNNNSNNNGNNKRFELRIRGPSGHVNKIASLKS